MSDAVSITRDLVRCPSVTPADAGALGVLENLLKTAGFEVHRVTFSEPGTADVHPKPFPDHVPREIFANADNTRTQFVLEGAGGPVLKRV